MDESNKLDLKSNNNPNIESKNFSKGPVNFLVGSMTSILLSIILYIFSNKIVIYFSIHKPTNSSDIVQNISSSINTLIIGLFFLLTFSCAFVGIGLFIVFIRSFFVNKSWISNKIIKKLFNVYTWSRYFNSSTFTRNDPVNITIVNFCWGRLNIHNVSIYICD